jgi:hypothetical protein
MESQKAKEEFDPGFKVDIRNELLSSTLRQEAMINVLMTEVAKMKAKQGFSFRKKSWKKLHDDMIEEARKHFEKIYDQMQKYL